MYPPPSAEDLHMLRQLRDRRRLKREVEQSDDERDVKEVADFLSAVVDTPFKPIHPDATDTRDMEASRSIRGNEKEKENGVPIVRLGDEHWMTGSRDSRRKRALCEVEGSTNDPNKAARTRKDSTAGKLRANALEPEAIDSFHSILARHSADRDAFDAFKSTISRPLFVDLGDFVNLPSDEEGDPFTHCSAPPYAPAKEVDAEVSEDDALCRAADALTSLASDLVSDGVDDAVLSHEKSGFEGCMAFDAESCMLGDSLTPSERESLTRFINESLDGDIEWMPFQPIAESSTYRAFDGAGLEASDDDASSAPISSPFEKISVSTAATTPSSILRRRNAPPTPISERKHVRFSKKNIRATCSTAGDSPSLIVSDRPAIASQSTSTSSTSSPGTLSSAPITRATLRRAQEARQARIEVLKSSKFCKIIDEYTVRCQLCKLNIGLGVDQVYDVRAWKKHQVEEEHTMMERDREERREERRRNKRQEKAI